MLCFGASDQAAERDKEGGEDSPSLTNAVINFEGVSLRVNENNPDAWPRRRVPAGAQRPLAEANAGGLQPNPHFTSF